jgi:C-terminal processing protease CtpA/Prc
MSELAYILNSATTRSLIILDEIGRGTSTYDGLSIAWATAEFISKRHIRTLFATHYHEMTVLENTMDGVRNLNVDVLEDNGNIVFLHKIVEGSAAANSDLQEKDIIVKFDDQSVTSLDDMQELLNRYAAGETINLTVKRPYGSDYEDVTVSITLTTDPDKAADRRQNASDNAENFRNFVQGIPQYFG